MNLLFSKIYNNPLKHFRILLNRYRGNYLTIFMYHGVIRSPLKIYDWCFINESLFRSQLKYIKGHFELVHLSQAIDLLSDGRINIPLAVITFDDGFQNNYDVAFSILREEGLPATIFLVTGLINTSDTVWFCRLNLALAETKRTFHDWNGYRFDLSRPIPKAKTASVIKDKLKELPHPQLMAELSKITLELGVDPDRPIEVDSPFRMLNHNAIEEMAASELIDFGAHTHSHAILSLLTPNERYEEITRSVTTIHELTGRPCELFAYPNGRAQDYNDETIVTLNALGVRASVTAIDGLNGAKTPLMQLRRYGIGADLSMNKFKRKLLRRIWRR